jgi:hypothetical protein
MAAALRAAWARFLSIPMSPKDGIGLFDNPLRLHHLAEPPYHTLANIGGVIDQLSIFGLLGVDLHSDGLIQYLLDLIHAGSLG